MPYKHTAPCGALVGIGLQDKPAPDTWGYYIWGACKECFRLLEATQNLGPDDPDTDCRKLYEHWEMGKMGFFRLPRPWMRFAATDKPDGVLVDCEEYDGPETHWTETDEEAEEFRRLHNGKA